MDPICVAQLISTAVTLSAPNGGYAWPGGTGLITRCGPPHLAVQAARAEEFGVPAAGHRRPVAGHDDLAHLVQALHFVVDQQRGPAFGHARDVAGQGAAAVWVGVCGGLVGIVSYGSASSARASVAASGCRCDAGGHD